MLMWRRKVKAVPNLSAARTRKPPAADDMRESNCSGASETPAVNPVSLNNNDVGGKPRSSLMFPLVVENSHCTVKNGATLAEHEIVTLGSTSRLETRPNHSSDDGKVARPLSNVDSVQRLPLKEANSATAADDKLPITAAVARSTITLSVQETGVKPAAALSAKRGLTRLNGPFKTFGTSFVRGNNAVSLPLRSKAKPTPKLLPSKKNVALDDKQTASSKKKINGMCIKETLKGNGGNHEQPVAPLAPCPDEPEPVQMGNLDNVEFVLADDVTSLDKDKEVHMDIEEGTFNVPVVENNAAVMMDNLKVIVEERTDTPQESFTSSSNASPSVNQTLRSTIEYAGGSTIEFIGSAKKSKEPTAGKLQRFDVKNYYTRWDRLKTLGHSVASRRPNSQPASLPIMRRVKATPNIPPRKMTAIKSAAEFESPPTPKPGASTEGEVENLEREEKIKEEPVTTDSTVKDDLMEVISPSMGFSEALKITYPLIEAPGPQSPAAWQAHCFVDNSTVEALISDGKVPTNDLVDLSSMQETAAEAKELQTRSESPAACQQHGIRIASEEIADSQSLATCQPYGFDDNSTVEASVSDERLEMSQNELKDLSSMTGTSIEEEEITEFQSLAECQPHGLEDNSTAEATMSDERSEMPQNKSEDLSSKRETTVEGEEIAESQSLAECQPHGLDDNFIAEATMNDERSEMLQNVSEKSSSPTETSIEPSPVQAIASEKINAEEQHSSDSLDLAITSEDSNGKEATDSLPNHSKMNRLSCVGSRTNSLLGRRSSTSGFVTSGGPRRLLGSRNRFKPNLNAERRVQTVDGAPCARKASAGSYSGPEGSAVNSSNAVSSPQPRPGATSDGSSGSGVTATRTVLPQTQGGQAPFSNKAEPLSSAPASYQSTVKENSSQIEDGKSQRKNSLARASSETNPEIDQHGSSSDSRPELAVGNNLTSNRQERAEVVVAPQTHYSTPTSRRTRKLTENRGVAEGLSQIHRRRFEHRRRFNRGVPDRAKLTMFDLIYYNPDNETKLEAGEDNETLGHVNLEAGASIVPKDDSNDGFRTFKGSKLFGTDDDLRSSAAAAAADMSANNEDESEEESLPAPQVMVGPNGEIVLDESSTMIETKAVKQAKLEMSNALVIVENSGGASNYGTWSKRRKKGKDWGELETLKFYKALSAVGTDFSMMETLFKNRSRHELKLKFKKEEKSNGALIDKCLRQQGQFTDLQEFMNEDTEEEEEMERKKKKPSRPRKAEKKRRKRSFRSNGYCDSSSGDEDDNTNEHTPARKRSRVTSLDSTASHVEKTLASAKAVADNVDNAAMDFQHSAAVERSTTPTPSPSSAMHSKLHDQSPMPRSKNGAAMPQNFHDVQFPAGLLAANPGLVGAKPGSLMVVASPTKMDRSAEVRQVSTLSDEKARSSGTEVSPGRAASPYCSSPAGKGMPFEAGVDMTLDPAIVRAVDKNRENQARMSGGSRATRRHRLVSFNERMQRMTEDAKTCSTTEHIQDPSRPYAVKSKPPTQ